MHVGKALLFLYKRCLQVLRAGNNFENSLLCTPLSVASKQYSDFPCLFLFFPIYHSWKSVYFVGDSQFQKFSQVLIDYKSYLFFLYPIFSMKLDFVWCCTITFNQYDSSRESWVYVHLVVLSFKAKLLNWFGRSLVWDKLRTYLYPGLTDIFYKRKIP